MNKYTFLCLGLFLTLISCKHTHSHKENENEEELNKTKIKILKAAQKLYSSFSTEYVFLDFNDKRRTQWEFLSVTSVPRTGVSLAKMSNQTKILTQKFLSSLLSSQGYLKINGIMHLDSVISKYFNNSKTNKYGQEKYHLTFYGEPSLKKNWGVSFEGHHLSLNFTFADMQISTTPLFLGTNPSSPPHTAYAGWRILSEEEDKAFILLSSLSIEQKKEAILAKKYPKDILTKPKAKQRLSDYWGIPASSLTTQQQNYLINLISEYANNYKNEIAKKTMATIKNELHKTYFAWIGNQQSDKPYYYLIHSPSFIIEFHSRKKGKKPSHIHSIWRHKHNDFGEDILQKHLKQKH